MRRGGAVFVGALLSMGCHQSVADLHQLVGERQADSVRALIAAAGLRAEEVRVHQRFDPQKLPDPGVAVEGGHVVAIRFRSRGSGPTSLQALRGLPALRALGITNHQLASVAGVEACTRLETLGLTAGTLTEVGGLQALGSLRELSLGSNRISRADLTGLRNLQNLMLSGNRLADASALAGLSDLGALQYLHLRDNPLASPGALSRQLPHAQIILSDPSPTPVHPPEPPLPLGFDPAQSLDEVDCEDLMRGPEYLATAGGTRWGASSRSTRGLLGGGSAEGSIKRLRGRVAIEAPISGGSVVVTVQRGTVRVHVRCSGPTGYVYGTALPERPCTVHGTFELSGPGRTGGLRRLHRFYLEAVDGDAEGVTYKAVSPRMGSHIVERDPSRFIRIQENVAGSLGAVAVTASHFSRRDYELAGGGATSGLTAEVSWNDSGRSYQAVVGLGTLVRIGNTNWKVDHVDKDPGLLIFRKVWNPAMKAQQRVEVTRFSAIPEKAEGWLDINVELTNPGPLPCGRPELKLNVYDRTRKLVDVHTFDAKALGHDELAAKQTIHFRTRINTIQFEGVTVEGSATCAKRE